MLHSVQALKKVEEHLPEGIDGLTAEQAKMIEGAITYQDEHVENVMTPISKVGLLLSMDTVLDSKTLRKIKVNGYSRIPICQNDD